MTYQTVSEKALLHPRWKVPARLTARHPKIGQIRSATQDLGDMPLLMLEIQVLIGREEAGPARRPDAVRMTALITLRHSHCSKRTS